MAQPVTETNLTMLYGTDTYFEGTVTNAASAAIDLTPAGISLDYLVRRSYSDASALLTKTKAAGVTARADGTYTVAILDSDKASLAVGNYVYALRYTATTGDVEVVARGQLSVLPSAAG